MHRTFALSAMLLLLCASLPAQRTAAPTTTGTPTLDSLFREKAAVAVTRLVAPSITASAQDTTTHWWKISFPAIGGTEYWARLRTHLLQSVRGRDSLPGDEVYLALDLKAPRVTADSMIISFSLGRIYRCPSNRWMEDTTGYEFVLVHKSDYWVEEKSPRAIWWSESFGLCR